MPTIERYEIDWQAIALALRRRRVSLPSLSTSLGKHDQWLSQLAAGDVQRVEFTDGLALLECSLHHLEPGEVLALRSLRPVHIHMAQDGRGAHMKELAAA